MKNFLNKKTVIVFLILASSAFFYFFKKDLNTPPANTRVGTVVRKDIIQRVTIAGTVRPYRKTIVTAPYDGYVKKLFVKIGDKVTQGAPLVSIAQSLQASEASFPLRSPLSGNVVLIEKSEGEYVKQGDPKDFILRIDDSSRFYVAASAPEIDRVKFKEGQEAVIKASAIPSRTYQGIIRDVSLAAKEKDAWSRSQVVEFPVGIEITDSDNKIMAGMSVVIDVISAKKDNVLTLRHEFIRRQNEAYFVILNDGKRQDIQVGIQNEDGFEITSGLEEGEKIKQIDFSDMSLAE